MDEESARLLNEAVENEAPPVGDFSSNGATSSNPNVIDLLRQEFQELVAAESVHIPIVGYSRIGLTAKYRLPEKGQELDIIGRAIEKEMKGESQYTKNLFIAIDTMIRLCEGLYVQPEGYDEPIELDPEERGSAVTYADCHEAFKFDPTMRTREVVRRIFGGPKHDMAILTHAEKLNRWLSNTNADLSLEFWQNQGE